jgi:hypothetical protein
MLHAAPLGETTAATGIGIAATVLETAGSLPTHAPLWCVGSPSRVGGSRRELPMVSMMKIGSRILVLFACLFSAASADAWALPTGLPPAGHVRIGVASLNPAGFDRLTRHHHDVLLMFDMLGGSWVKWHGVSTQIDKATASHRIAMITLGVTRVSDRHKFSPGELAGGKADSIYISYSRQANGTGVPVWIRPMQEMNGYWMSWCAFNQNGSRRGLQYSTAKFRAAFRRIAIIMRGGTRDVINARLHAAGLRRLQTSISAAGIEPSGQIALVWNPQGAGAPNVSGNQPKDYWPGRNYVDFVGDDLYSQHFRAYWKGMGPLYNMGKPFILGEWAPWGTDDPTFVKAVFNWAKYHPRTAAIVYYDYSSTFDLSRKPRSLAAYRTLAARPMFNTSVP